MPILLLGLILWAFVYVYHFVKNSILSTHSCDGCHMSALLQNSPENV